jgi:hypothetical protein
VSNCILVLSLCQALYSNMTPFKLFESKPVVKITYTYTHCNWWRHRQFITIFYIFLHIRIEIIHGSHMYILFLPRVGLYVSILPLAYARGKTSWYKVLPVEKQYIHMDSKNYFFFLILVLGLCQTLYLYPPQRSCRGVYWLHHVLPSVRPSVRPSFRPSFRPSVRPSFRPSVRPSVDKSYIAR